VIKYEDNYRYEIFHHTFDGLFSTLLLVRLKTTTRTASTIRINISISISIGSDLVIIDGTSGVCKNIMRKERSCDGKGM